MRRRSFLAMLSAGMITSQAQEMVRNVPIPNRPQTGSRQTSSSFIGIERLLYRGKRRITLNQEHRVQ
jgi:hypothetical protein